MTEAQLVTKLHDLHETRMTMSHHSIYHGTYQAEAIELNTQLFDLTGRNYSDYLKHEVETMLFQSTLLE